MQQILFKCSLLLALAGTGSISVANYDVFAPPSALNDANITKVQAFLQSQQVIRVGISKAPGNGHQSAGATVITRLRELGYQGLIEVIFHEGVADKLEYLIPPYRSSRLPLFSQEKNIRFIPKRLLRAAARQTVPLGIMGADDWDWAPADLNVQTLLTLQPLEWSQPSTLRSIGYPVYKLEHLSRLGFIFSPPNPPSIDDFIRVEMSHLPVLQKKVTGLQTILKARPKSELGAVYGLSIPKGWQLINYILGIGWALSKDPAAFKDGGIILPVLSQFKVSQWQAFAERAKEIPHVETIAVEDITEEKVRSLRRGQILIVNVGPVAKSVFEYLYAASEIPPIVEGKNSANFMQILGFPYLPSSPRTSFHLRSSLKDPSGAFVPGGEIAITAGEALLTPTEDAQLIGRFILAVKDPRSDLRRLFAQSHSELDPIAHDKITQGLLAVIDRFESKEPPPPKPASLVDRMMSTATNWCFQILARRRNP